MRAKAREVAFQIVFASRFGEAEKGLKTALYKNLNKDDVEYCERVLSLVEEHETDFAQILDERSRAFPESRLFPADKSILLIALAEILHMDDIPFAVSLNEAANIASKYSSEKSASFISGILSEVKKV
ncbi:MAG: transcription antitermination protein NusB [Clostridia bacterium]|nr:transcription antitermination protein NusB [Clostridia bacterium]